MNRAEFMQKLNVTSYSPEDMRRIHVAYWFAKEIHRRQFRDGGERYFEHVRAVALLVHEFGYKQRNAICAALLHDGPEDTHTPVDAYLHMFGPVVWHWIETLSKKIPHHDELEGNVTFVMKKDVNTYFEKISFLPKEARAIKCCDRLHNLRTMGMEWTSARKRKYIIETNEYILPLADATDPVIAKAIRTEVARIEKELGDISAPITV